jgi:hypothetical protein
MGSLCLTFTPPIYITKKAIDFPFDFARVIENEAHSLIVAIKE